MSDIPTEIFLEILQRVPAEDLFQLRSVCKTWLRIIDDPAFAKLHIHRGKGEDWLIVKPHNGGKIYLFPLKEMVSKKVPSVKCVLATKVKTLVGRGVPRIRYLLPVPSCNGLMLISSCKKGMFWRIWNPFTGESLKLGQCDVFENVECTNTYIPYSGIGFDEANDDYKVVRIDEFRTFIYSVNLKEWHRIEDFPFPKSHIVDENGIFAYGALHWVAYSKGENGSPVSIAALDLSTEKYRKVAVPSETTEGVFFCLRLVTLSECLFISTACLSGHFVLWMIKGYGSEDTWVKIVSLEGNFLWTPIAYLKSKEWILLGHNNRICCCYDLVNKCTERILMEVTPQIDDIDNYHCIYEPFSCQVLPASLVRLMARDGSDESVASKGTSKKKGKRTVANERLAVKIYFGDVQ